MNDPIKGLLNINKKLIIISRNVTFSYFIVYLCIKFRVCIIKKDYSIENGIKILFLFIYWMTRKSQYITIHF